MTWISVKDRLPEEGETVLVFSHQIYTAHRYVYHGENFWFCSCMCCDGSQPGDVTHWMPLPKPPKVE